MPSDFKGLVSIIMPLYNCERYVAESIHSVLDQTYSNWELIVVDDGSTDGSFRIVEQISKVESRIRLFSLGERKGVAFARNIALQEARGKWIAFLDSDDCWFANKLEEQIRFMVNHDIAFSYTNYQEMTEEGVLTGYYWTGPKYVNFVTLRIYDFLGTLTVMYDRERIGSIQGQNLIKGSDYALWLQISRHTSAYLLDKVLATYRIRLQGSVTKRQAGAWRLLPLQYHLFRVVEQCSAPVAFVWTGLYGFASIIKKKVFKKKLQVSKNRDEGK